MFSNGLCANSELRFNNQLNLDHKIGNSRLNTLSISTKQPKIMISTTYKSTIVSWMIASASKCYVSESELFKMFVVNAVLSSLTEKLPIWKSILISAWRIFSVLLWAILILIVISSLGRSLAFGATSIPSITVATPQSITVQHETPLDQRQENKVKVDLNTALTKSREQSLKVASKELDRWIVKLMKKVDDPNNNHDFLDWYFGYWTQQGFGLNAVAASGIHLIDKNSPNAQSKLQENVRKEFTNRVFRPEIAKLELKNISRRVSLAYANELEKNIEDVRIVNKISTADWDGYLQGLAISIADVNGRPPLNVKAFSIGSASGTLLLAKSTLIAIEKVSAKIGAKILTKVLTSLSVKVGIISGSNVLAPLATIAIVTWDAIDIHNTGTEYRPILKNSIQDYFKEMKGEILTDGENGIEKLISDTENNIRRGVNAFHFPFLPF